MLLRVACSLSLLFASTTMVVSAEVCISCASPDVSYRCTIEKSDRIDKLPDSHRVIERICTKVLAKSGNHAKCAVSAASTECAGDLKTIGMAEAREAITSVSSDGKSGSQVEGLLPGAYRVTTEGLQKTGEAIGGSAKTAWDCVASLFKAC